MSSHAIRVLVGVILLASIYGLAAHTLEPVNAQVSFDYNLTLNSYSVSVAPTHSEYVQVTVSLVSGTPRPVNLTSTISPQDGQLTTSFDQSSGTPTFTTTLTVTAYATPAGKQYAITVSGSSQGVTRQAPVLTVTISCPQGACPQPHLDSIDKTTYVQGQSIQFSGSNFIPGDATASCLTNNVSPVICQNQANADSQGDVSGSMQVAPTVSPGTQYFYLKDTTNDQQTQALQITILATSTSEQLTTAIFGNGTVTPSCPSGCGEPIGQAISITASPEPNWIFSQWSITGATCSNGPNTNPCTFTMPSNAVSVIANFIQGQFQTLYTGYTGLGTVSPSCPSGCPISVGSTVSIQAIPASGWALSGYQVTTGVSCSSLGGYTCSFPMPNFPVTFTASFAAESISSTISTTMTSTIQTSVTSTTTVVSLTTSTTTISTISVEQAGSTLTTTTYSTVTGSATQTQLSSITQFSTLTATVAAIATTVENPTLELALAAIILLSALTIGIGVVRRAPPRGTVTCANCGVKNVAWTKYCVSCGEPLGRASKA